ncbi:MAG: metallopeptidase [Planctomycetota bacterium]
MAGLFMTGCTGSPRPAQVVVDTPVTRSNYQTFDPVVQQVEGWTLYVDPKLLDAVNAEEDARALAMLVNHLQRINVYMPAERLAEMQTVGVWIEVDHFDNVEPGPYHPSAKWLTENGYDPKLAKKVHVTRAASLLDPHHMDKHPAVILHELAHGYHDQILGFDEPRIKAAYDRAMAQGLYQQVVDYRGHQVRAYAATNDKEYFAEAVEAYFYVNDFYPFNRAELKAYDPVMYELLVEIFGAKD